MSKIEFLNELEGLLIDIPMEERQEALQYYAGYFDDAGPDKEQNIITELVSPAKVAASIKADLFISKQESQNRGIFTENGYEDDTISEPKYEVIDGTAMKQEKEHKNENYNYSETAKDYENPYSSSSTEDRTQEHANNNGFTKIALIILLCIFLIPVGIPVLVTVFSLFLAIIITAGCFCLTFVITSFILVVVGISLAIAGVIKLITVPVIGILLTGAGLILFGIGLLFTMATIGITTKLIPAIIRGFVNICRVPFKNRSVTA